jgi:hypothetical protein
MKENGCRDSQEADPQPPYSGFVGFWRRMGNSSDRTIGNTVTGKEEWIAMNEKLSIGNKIITWGRPVYRGLTRVATVGLNPL